MLATKFLGVTVALAIRKFILFGPDVRIVPLSQEGVDTEPTYSQRLLEYHSNYSSKQTKRKNENETKNGNGRVFLESKPIVYNFKKKS